MNSLEGRMNWKINTYLTSQELPESQAFQHKWMAILLMVSITVFLEIIVVNICSYLQKKFGFSEKRSSDSQEKEDNHFRRKTFAVENRRDGVHLSARHRVKFLSERFTSELISRENKDNFEDRILSSDEIIWGDNSETEYQLSHFGGSHMLSSGSSHWPSSSCSIFNSELRNCIPSPREQSENENETVQFSSKELLLMLKTNKNKKSRFCSHLHPSETSKFTIENEDTDVTSCLPIHLVLSKRQFRLLEENLKSQIALKLKAALKSELTNLCSRAEDFLIQNKHLDEMVISAQAQDYFQGQNVILSQKSYEAQSTSQVQQFVYNQESVNKQPDTKTRCIVQPEDLMKHIRRLKISSSIQDFFQAHSKDGSQCFIEVPCIIEIQDSVNNLESDEHLCESQCSVGFDDSSKIKYSTKGQNCVFNNAECLIAAPNPSLISEDVPQVIPSSELKQYPARKGQKRRKIAVSKSKLSLKVSSLKTKKAATSQVFQSTRRNTSKNKNDFRCKNKTEKEEIYQMSGRADVALHVIFVSKLTTPYIKNYFKRQLVKVMPDLIKSRYLMQKQNKSPGIVKVSFVGSTERGISGIIKNVKMYGKENKGPKNMSPNMVPQLEQSFMANANSLNAPCSSLETKWKNESQNVLETKLQNEGERITEVLQKAFPYDTGNFRFDAHPPKENKTEKKMHLPVPLTVDSPQRGPTPNVTMERSQLRTTQIAFQDNANLEPIGNPVNPTGEESGSSNKSGRREIGYCSAAKKAALPKDLPAPSSETFNCSTSGLSCLREKKATSVDTTKTEDDNISGNFDITPWGKKPSKSTYTPLKLKRWNVDFSNNLRTKQLNIYSQNKKNILRSISFCILHQLGIEISNIKVSPKTVLSSKNLNTMAEKASNRVSIAVEQPPYAKEINLHVGERKENQQESTGKAFPTFVTHFMTGVCQIPSLLGKKAITAGDSPQYHASSTMKGKQPQKSTCKALPKLASHSKADLLQTNAPMQQVKLSAINMHCGSPTSQTREAFKQMDMINGYPQDSKKQKKLQHPSVSCENFKEHMCYQTNLPSLRPHLMPQTKQALPAAESVPSVTSRQMKSQNAMLHLESSGKTVKCHNIFFSKRKKSSDGRQIVEMVSDASSSVLRVRKKAEARVSGQKEQGEMYLPGICLHSLSLFMSFLHENKRQMSSINQRGMKDKICSKKSTIKLKNRFDATDYDTPVKRLKLQCDIREKTIHLKHRKSEPGLVMTEMYEPILSLPHYKLDETAIDEVISNNVKGTQQHISQDEKNRLKALEMKGIMDPNITLKAEKSSVSPVLSGKEQKSIAQEDKGNSDTRLTICGTSLPSPSYLHLNSRIKARKDIKGILKSCLPPQEPKALSNVKRVSFKESANRDISCTIIESKYLPQHKEDGENIVNVKDIMDLKCITLTGKTLPFRHVQQVKKPQWNDKKEKMMERDKNNTGVAQNKPWIPILPPPYLEWDPKINEAYMQEITGFCLPSLTVQELSGTAYKEPTDDILSSIKREKYALQKERVEADSEEIMHSERIALRAEQSSVSQELMISLEKKTQGHKEVDIPGTSSESFPPCSDVDTTKGEEAVQMKTGSCVFQLELQVSPDAEEITYKEPISGPILNDVKNTLGHAVQNEEETIKMEKGISLNKNKPAPQEIQLDIKEREEKLQRMEDEPNMTKTSTCISSLYLKLDSQIEEAASVTEVTRYSVPERSHIKSSDAVKRVSKELIKGSITSDKQKAKENRLHPNIKGLEGNRALSWDLLLSPKEQGEMDLPSKKKEKTDEESKEQEKQDHDGKEQGTRDVQTEEEGKVDGEIKEQGKTDTESEKQGKVHGEGNKQEKSGGEEQGKQDQGRKEQGRFDLGERDQMNVHVEDEEQKKTGGEDRGQVKVKGKGKDQWEEDTKGNKREKTNLIDEEQVKLYSHIQEQRKINPQGKAQKKLGGKVTKQWQIGSEGKEQGEEVDSESEEQEKTSEKAEAQGNMDRARKEQEKIGVHGEGRNIRAQKGRQHEKMDAEAPEPEKTAASKQQMKTNGESREQWEVRPEWKTQDETDLVGKGQQTLDRHSQEQEEIHPLRKVQGKMDGQGNEQGKGDGESDREGVRNLDDKNRGIWNQEGRGQKEDHGLRETDREDEEQGEMDPMDQERESGDESDAHEMGGHENEVQEEWDQEGRKQGTVDLEGREQRGKNGESEGQEKMGLRGKEAEKVDENFKNQEKVGQKSTWKEKTDRDDQEQRTRGQERKEQGGMNIEEQEKTSGKDTEQEKWSHKDKEQGKLNSQHKEKIDGDVKKQAQAYPQSREQGKVGGDGKEHRAMSELHELEKTDVADKQQVMWGQVDKQQGKMDPQGKLQGGTNEEVGQEAQKKDLEDQEEGKIYGDCSKQEKWGLESKDQENWDRGGKEQGKMDPQNTEERKIDGNVKEKGKMASERLADLDGKEQVKWDQESGEQGQVDLEDLEQGKTDGESKEQEKWDGEGEAQGEIAHDDKEQGRTHIDGHQPGHAHGEGTEQEKWNPEARCQGGVNQDSRKQGETNQESDDEPEVVMSVCLNSESFLSCHEYHELDMKIEEHIQGLTRSVSQLQHQKSFDEGKTAHTKSIEDDKLNNRKNTEDCELQKGMHREKLLSKKYIQHPEGTTAMSNELPLPHLPSVMEDGGQTSRKGQIHISEKSVHEQKIKHELDEIRTVSSLPHCTLSEGVKVKEEKQAGRSLFLPSRHMKSLDAEKLEYTAFTLNSISGNSERTVPMTCAEEAKTNIFEKDKMHPKLVRMKTKRSPLSYILKTKNLQVKIKEQRKRMQEGSEETVVLLSKTCVCVTSSALSNLGITKEETCEPRIVESSAPHPGLQKSPPLEQTATAEPTARQEKKRKQNLPQREERVQTGDVDSLRHPGGVIFKTDVAASLYKPVTKEHNTLSEKKEPQWNIKVKVGEKRERTRDFNVVLTKTYPSRPAPPRSSFSPSEEKFPLSSESGKIRDGDSNESSSIHNVILEANQQKPIKEAEDRVKTERADDTLLAKRAGLGAETTQVARTHSEKKLPVYVKEQNKGVKEGHSELEVVLRKTVSSLPSLSNLKLDTRPSKKEVVVGRTQFYFPPLKTQGVSDSDKKAYTKLSKMKEPIQSKTQEEETDKLKMDMKDKLFPRCVNWKVRKLPLCHIVSTKELQWKNKEQKRKMQEDKKELMIHISNRIAKLSFLQLQSEELSDAGRTECSKATEGDLSSDVKGSKEHMLVEEKKGKERVVSMNNIIDSKDIYLKTKESLILRTHNLSDLHCKNKEREKKVQEDKQEPVIMLTNTSTGRSPQLFLNPNTKIKEESAPMSTKSSDFTVNFKEPSSDSEGHIDLKPIHGDILISLQNGKQHKQKNSEECAAQIVKVIIFLKCQEVELQESKSEPGEVLTKSDSSPSLPHLKLDKKIGSDEEVLKYSRPAFQTLSSSGERVPTESVGSDSMKVVKAKKQDILGKEEIDREKIVDRRGTDITLKSKKSPASSKLHRSELHIHIRRHKQEDHEHQGKARGVIVLRKGTASRPSPPTLKMDKGKQMEKERLGNKTSSLRPLVLSTLSEAEKTTDTEITSGHVRKRKEHTQQQERQCELKTADMRVVIHRKEATMSPISEILKAKEFVLNMKMLEKKDESEYCVVLSRSFLSIPSAPLVYLDSKNRIDKDTPGITGFPFAQQKELSHVQKTATRGPIKGKCENIVKRAEQEQKERAPEVLQESLGARQATPHRPGKPGGTNRADPNAARESVRENLKQNRLEMDNICPENQEEGKLKADTSRGTYIKEDKIEKQKNRTAESEKKKMDSSHSWHVKQEHKKKQKLAKEKQNVQVQKSLQKKVLYSFYGCVPLKDCSGRLIITDPKHLTMKISDHPVSQTLGITGCGASSNRVKLKDDFKKQKSTALWNKSASGVFIRNLSVCKLSPPCTEETGESETNVERRKVVSLSELQMKLPNTGDIDKRDQLSVGTGEQNVASAVLPDSQLLGVNEQQMQNFSPVNSERNLKSEINKKEFKPQTKERNAPVPDDLRIRKTPDLPVRKQEEKMPHHILMPAEHPLMFNDMVETNTSEQVPHREAKEPQCGTRLLDTSRSSLLPEEKDQHELRWLTTMPKAQPEEAVSGVMPTSQAKSDEIKVLAGDTSADCLFSLYKATKTTVESLLKNVTQDKVSSDKLEKAYKLADLESPPFLEVPATLSIAAHDNLKHTPLLKLITPEENNRLTDHFKSKVLEIKLNLIPEMAKISIEKFNFHLKEDVSEGNHWRLYPRHKKTSFVSPEGFDSTKYNLKYNYQKDISLFSSINTLIGNVSSSHKENLTKLKNKNTESGRSLVTSASETPLWPHILQKYSVKGKDRLLMHFSVKTLEIRMSAFSKIVRESYAIANIQVTTKPLFKCIHSAVEVPKQKNKILLLFEEKSFHQIDLDLQKKYLRFLQGRSAESTVPKPNVPPKVKPTLNTNPSCGNVGDSRESHTLFCDTERLQQHSSFKKQSLHESSFLLRKFLESTNRHAFDPGLHSMAQKDTSILSELESRVTSRKDKPSHITFQATDTYKSFDTKSQEKATSLIDSQSNKIFGDFINSQINIESSSNLEKCPTLEVGNSNDYVFLESSAHLSRESQDIPFELQKGIPLEYLYKKKQTTTYLKPFYSEDSSSHHTRAYKKQTLFMTPPSYKLHKDQKHRSSSKTQSPDWLDYSSLTTLDIQSTTSSSISFGNKISWATSSETSYFVAPLTETNIRLHVTKSQGKCHVHPERNQRKKARKSYVPRDHDHGHINKKEKHTQKSELHDNELEISYYPLQKHRSTSKPSHEDIAFHFKRKENSVPFFYACVPADSLMITPKTIRWTIPPHTLKKKNFKIPLVAKISDSSNVWSLSKRLFESLSAHFSAVHPR